MRFHAMLATVHKRDGNGDCLVLTFASELSRFSQEKYFISIGYEEKGPVVWYFRYVRI
jgi:hypothetical protein